MKTRYLLATAALVGGGFLALNPAHAGTIDVVWSFDSPTGNLGNTNTYASTPPLVPPENIVASGFAGTNPGTATALFGKNVSAGEQGLGLANDASGQDEITPGNFVQLDLSQLHSPPLLSTTLSFQSNSTTNGEEWEVLGTNTAGTLAGATVIDTGTNENLVAALPGTIIGTFKFLDVTELTAGGNILIHELDNSIATGVPEPASLALLGAGLLGLGLVRRRKS